PAILLHDGPLCTLLPSPEKNKPPEKPKRNTRTDMTPAEIDFAAEARAICRANDDDERNGGACSVGGHAPKRQKTEKQSSTEGSQIVAAVISPSLVLKPSRGGNRENVHSTDAEVCSNCEVTYRNRGNQSSREAMQSADWLFPIKKDGATSSTELTKNDALLSVTDLAASTSRAASGSSNTGQGTDNNSLRSGTTVVKKENIAKSTAENLDDSLALPVESTERMWQVQRKRKARSRAREMEAAEHVVMQKVIDERRGRITQQQIWARLIEAGALTNAASKYDPKSAAARKYVSRLMGGWEVRNTATQDVRDIDAIPRSKPNFSGNTMGNLKRFESILRTWCSFHLTKKKIRKFMNWNENADLAGCVDLVSVDEVPVLKFYVPTGGFDTCVTVTEKGEYCQERENNSSHGSVMAWACSNPALRIPPLVVLSRDWVIGKSHRLETRYKDCVHAIGHFGTCEVNPANARNGYVTRDMFWDALNSFGKNKRTIVGWNKPCILLFDECNSHSYTDVESDFFVQEYNIWFVRIG
ncbi:unnamed protein product, partial [Amoebophrya sp. A25]